MIKSEFMVKQYRKKPVIIDAIELFTGFGLNTVQECEDFTEGNGKWDKEKRGFIIKTLEGDHLANDGDFIIKGINGEYYPCKPDIFEKTYEEVTSWEGV